MYIYIYIHTYIMLTNIYIYIYVTPGSAQPPFCRTLDFQPSKHPGNYE